ncbi:OadG family protein [Brevibacillus gelatini]
MSVILTILGIGFVLFILAVILVVTLLKKGARFFRKMGGHGYRKYSSSDYRHRGSLWSHGHKTHGHHYYRHKHSSHSGFFSS